MPTHGTTITAASKLDSTTVESQPAPGIVVIFAAGRACFRGFRWERAPLEFGRLELTDDATPDALISRKHVSFDFDGSGWLVKDLGSRNGTFVAGVPATSPTNVPSGTPVRVGGALLLPVDDLLAFKRFGLGARDGIIVGPTLGKVLESIALASSTGMLNSLLISGESGSGKENAAQTFHLASAKPNAPFVALNCATIPKDLAERLLFGSRRGAFTGAADAPGQIQAAHGGTLFLDEVAELPPEVQSKLLRMLETREVLRLGATTPETVDVRICAATWRDLRSEVARGRFREDLYFRIGQPEIRLPPLRERPEEIPWHIQQVLEKYATAGQLNASAAFVEACMGRHWPGNVRELRAEVQRAAATAAVANFRPLIADDLAASAGKALAAPPAAPLSEASYPNDEMADALRAEAGNVVGAARRLGVHRNRVRRWLDRHGIDAQIFKSRPG